MNRSEVLRDLYEALDMLDAVQTGAARPAPTAFPIVAAPSSLDEFAGDPVSVDLTGGHPVIDLRDPYPGSDRPAAGTVLPGVGGLRHQVRLRLGADWDSSGRH